MRGGSRRVLIGAVTLAVAAAAVYFSYHANEGLPLAPAYRIEAQAPSAANLIAGNEVRMGGARVGTVETITVRRLQDGGNVAVLALELEPAVGPLPRDTTFVIRPRSALGAKYVELTRGSDPRGLADGAALPLRAARPVPVELDEVLDTFDPETRAAVQGNLRGLGDALAGRGRSLNDAIAALRPLVRDLGPVARSLSDPDTALARLVTELADAARIVAPAAAAQAQLFVDLDITFGALRRVARPFLQDAISGAPPPLDAGVEELPRQRPYLAEAERLARELRPAARALRAGAADIAGALVAGTPALRRTPPFNDRLASLLAEVQAVAEDPAARAGVRRLTATTVALRPTLEFAAPAQTTCNYLTLLLRNAASVLSEGDAVGTWQRFIIIPTPLGPNNEGGPASAPADGPGEDNHLHANPYPHAAPPGRPAECEAGNEPFARGRTALTNPPGVQRATTEATTR